MSKPKQTNESKAEPSAQATQAPSGVAPEQVAPVPTPALTRVEYTGQTAGSIRLDDGTVLVAHVEPGDVLDPETPQTRQALLATGHFQLTRRRATPSSTPTEGQE